jgi:hypothetical protein
MTATTIFMEIPSFRLVKINLHENMSLTNKKDIATFYLYFKSGIGKKEVSILRSQD